MPRYHETDTRWLRAACVAGAYLVGVATLFTLHIGAVVVLPISVAVSAPPLLYAALSLVVVRHAPLVRRISWVGSACLTHGLLSVLAAAELMWAGGLRPLAALAQVFVLFAPAPALTLLATPVVLALCGAPRPRPTTRADSPAPRRPTPAAAHRPRPFARAASVVTGEVDPGAASVPFMFTPGPTVTMARPAAAAAPAVPPPAAPGPDPVVAPPVSEARGARHAPLIAPGSEPMVRVSFERVAAQLPAEAFVLPFDRLAESLKEPHALLVPRRIVLAEMREGGIAIDWATVAAQFPDLALGMSGADFRYRYPNLKLLLPIDEVLAQLPPDAIPLASAVLNRASLDVPPPVMPSVNGLTITRQATPGPLCVVSIAPPDAAGMGVPEAPPAMTVAPPPAPISPLRSSVVAPPGMVATAALESSPELIDRDTVARIVACFSGVGTFEAAPEPVGTTTLICLVEPGLSRRAVATCAARVVRFLAEGAGEVITVRTTRSIVVLAAGPAPVVVAARRPGAPVALLELRATRAAVTIGDGAVTPKASPRRRLRPLTVDGRVAGAAQALTSFGLLEATVFADGDARVYVFSAGGRDAAPLGGLALSVCEALADGSGDLGGIVSVVFRRGDARTLVRPLAGAAVLAAAGPVTRPGRLHRDADRAAAMLEAL